MPSPPISILQPLSPRVFVLQSQDVREACQANGCTGLEEIVRPWEGSVERVSVLSSTLTPTVHPSFPLRFVSFESVYQPQTGPSFSPSSRAAGEDPDVIIDVISTLVAKNKPEQELHYPVTRSVLLASRPELAAHETFNHPVCFMIAVSTSNPEPVQSFAKLYHQSLTSAGGTGAWVDTTNCLRFYVLVHDVSKMGEAGQTVQNLLAQIKKMYGPHCTLLIINSRLQQDGSPAASPGLEKDSLAAPTALLHPHPTTPSPRSLTLDEPPSVISGIYAAALSSLTLSPFTLYPIADPGLVTNVPKRAYGLAMDSTDAQRIASLIRELVVQSLVPWMEGRVREWNETYLANRRGITGRLFGAGRKFFGSRPASPAPGQGQTGYNTVKGYYPAASTEALSRRLADFAFMLRDYKLASSIYDSLRRDFAQDRAWRYSASATEMYGLSLLLSHQIFLPSSPPTNIPHPFTNLQHTDISSWLEQSVAAYLTRSPPLQLDAMRATIMYHEAWRILYETRGVSQALMRAAGDMEEVPSAVLMEEAAQVDVKGPARGIYKPKRRRQAVHLVMAAYRYEKSGHKAYSRRCLERASLVYRTAPWTAAQDHIEYALGRQAYTLGESDVSVEHFLRLLRKEDDVGGVVSSGAQRGVLDDLKLAYDQLASKPEELARAADKLVLPAPIFDVSQVAIRTGSSFATGQGWRDLENEVLSQGWLNAEGRKPTRVLPDTTKAVTAVNEPFFIELLATNPLNAPLSLFRLTATVEGGEADVETLTEIQLGPLEARRVSLRVTAKSSGQLRPARLDFSFHNILPVTQMIDKRGKRLFGTKQDRLQPTYAQDRTLDVTIVASRPRISARLELGEEKLYEGETRGGTLVVTNTGSSVVSEVTVSVSQAGWLHFGGDVQAAMDGPIDNRIPRRAPSDLPVDTLQAGQSVSIFVECTGSCVGVTELLILVVGQAVGFEEIVVAQTACTVDVLPLLQVFAASAPSKRDAATYLVDVEILNPSTESVMIESISAVSPYWYLIGEGYSATDETDGIGTSLMPGQKETSLLRFKGPDPSIGTLDLDLAETSTVGQLAKLLEGRPLAEIERTITLQATLPALTMRRYLASRSLHRLSWLSQSLPAIPLHLLPSIFCLIPPLDLDLAVNWFIPGTSRGGTTFHHALHPTPRESMVESLRSRPDGAFKRTMYEETDRLQRELLGNVLDGEIGISEDPVHHMLQLDVDGVNGVVLHDFAAGPRAVNASLIVRNQSPTIGCRYRFTLPQPRQSQSSTASPPHYAGRLTHCGELSPLETASLRISAWIHEPGWYTLGGWELLTEIGMQAEQWEPLSSWERIGEDDVLEVKAL